MSDKLRPSQIWGAIVRKWNLDFMAPSDVGNAMEAISKARVGLADEISPECLYPVGFGANEWSLPIKCGAYASRGSHSIQEAGPLNEIAAPGGKGLYVLGFFPNVSHLMRLTKGVAGRPGTKWLWDVDAIPPRSVPIGEASVAHFACGIHDSGSLYLGAADNLHVPDLGGRVILDDRDPPAGLNQFLHSLFMLAYRTLLFRLSQFRGVQKTVIRALSEQADADNRFGEHGCIERLRELAPVLTEIGREKSAYDRRILGDASALGLVHHVVEFNPGVRYACCEFIPFKYRNGSQKKSIWAAVNVLPINGRNWLILSHRFNRNSDIIAISKEVAAWATVNPALRKRRDFDSFVDFTNVFASPNDFYALLESDRSLVALRMAWKVCEEPFEEGLNFLRSSPRGLDLVKRCERELGSTGSSTVMARGARNSRRFCQRR